jgi:hypothetical protein
VQQIQRDLEHVRLARALDPVALQGAEVVCITELGPKLLENFPVAPLALLTEPVGQVAPQIGDHRVVVEQRVVDVDEKDDVVRRSHAWVSTSGGQGALA